MKLRFFPLALAGLLWLSGMQVASACPKDLRYEPVHFENTSEAEVTQSHNEAALGQEQENQKAEETQVHRHWGRKRRHHRRWRHHRRFGCKKRGWRGGKKGCPFARRGKWGRRYKKGCPFARRGKKGCRGGKRGCHGRRGRFFRKFRKFRKLKRKAWLKKKYFKIKLKKLAKFHLHFYRMLSHAQKKAFKRMRLQMVRALMPLKARVHLSKAELLSEALADNPNQKNIDARIKAWSNAKFNLLSKRAGFFLQARGLLNGEKQKKMHVYKWLSGMKVKKHIAKHVAKEWKMKKTLMMHHLKRKMKRHHHRRWGKRRWAKKSCPFAAKKGRTCGAKKSSCGGCKKSRCGGGKKGCSKGCKKGCSKGCKKGCSKGCGKKKSSCGGGWDTAFNKAFAKKAGCKCKGCKDGKGKCKAGCKCAKKAAKKGCKKGCKKPCCAKKAAKAGCKCKGCKDGKGKCKAGCKCAKKAAKKGCKKGCKKPCCAKKAKKGCPFAARKAAAKKCNGCPKCLAKLGIKKAGKTCGAKKGCSKGCKKSSCGGCKKGCSKGCKKGCSKGCKKGCKRGCRGKARGGCPYKKWSKCPFARKRWGKGCPYKRWGKKSCPYKRWGKRGCPYKRFARRCPHFRKKYRRFRRHHRGHHGMWKRVKKAMIYGKMKRAFRFYRGLTPAQRKLKHQLKYDGIRIMMPLKAQLHLEKAKLLSAMMDLNANAKTINAAIRSLVNAKANLLSAKIKLKLTFYRSLNADQKVEYGFLKLMHMKYKKKMRKVIHKRVKFFNGLIRLKIHKIMKKWRHKRRWRRKMRRWKRWGHKWGKWGHHKKRGKSMLY